jgi:hypothetical protein
VKYTIISMFLIDQSEEHQTSTLKGQGQSTTSCNSTNENVYCPNGNFQSFTEPCNRKYCPIARRMSSIALSTDNCPSKCQCFDARDKNHLFNKVCIQTANFIGEDFSKYCDENAEICKKYVTTKNKFSQCIVSGTRST